MASKVEIYTWKTCPYCIRAKSLLDQKGIEFIEYRIDGDQVAHSEMSKRASGRSSVPQIFINDQHIGGCDDIYTLNSQGKLDALLV